MKKIIVILLSAVMILTVSAASADSLLGSWKVAEDTGITEENKAVFDKAMEGLLGVGYEPVAYLGSQLVAGTNHCFLCKATVVYPDAEPTLALVYVYEKLDGTVEITNITDLNIAELSTPAIEAED